MLIIGEKLNSSIPSVKKLFDADDFDALSELVLKQRDAGAAFIDLNTALCANETETMKKLCDIVLEKTDCGFVIDSPDTSVSASVLQYIREKSDRSCIINSITVNERHENIETALKFKAGLVVLLTDEKGIPDSAEKRFANAERMISFLRERGFDDGDIYIDVITESAAVNPESAAAALDTIKLIRVNYPDVHILVGLSNISYGLPRRGVINSAFLTLAVYNGLDNAICDPLSPDIKNAYLAAEVLNGSDDFCMEYIDAFR